MGCGLDTDLHQIKETQLSSIISRTWLNLQCDHLSFKSSEIIETWWEFRESHKGE